MANQTDLDILIRTSADLSGIEGTIGKLKELTEEARKSTSARGGSPESTSADPLGAVGTKIAGIVAGALTAKAALNGVIGALSAFAEKETAITQLDVALNNLGQLAGNTRERLINLAEALEEETNVASTRWLATITRLSNALGSTENVDQYTKTIRDLAGLMGGNLEGATQAFIRALNGNAQALRSVGLVLDENLTKSERLAKINEFAARGANVLADQTKTLKGAYETLTTATGNLQENTGRALSRFLNLPKVLQVITEIVKLEAGSMADLAGKTQSVVTPTQALGTASEDTADNIGATAEQARSAAEAFQALADGYTKARQQAEALIAVQQRQLDAAAQLAELTGGASAEEAALARDQGILAGDFGRNFEARKEAENRFRLANQGGDTAGAQQAGFDIELSRQTDIELRLRQQGLTARRNNLIAQNVSRRAGGGGGDEATGRFIDQTFAENPEFAQEFVTTGQTVAATLSRAAAGIQQAFNPILAEAQRLNQVIQGVNDRVARLETQNRQGPNR
jgi:hypothetical protein